MTRLMLLVRLMVRLLVGLLIRLGVALPVGLWLVRHVGLRLTGAECRVVNHRLLAVIALVEHVVARAPLHVAVGPRQVWIVLAELFLRACDQPIIVFGMLIVVFRRYGIAGGLRIARKLNIFFG